MFYELVNINLDMYTLTGSTLSFPAGCSLGRRASKRCYPEDTSVFCIHNSLKVTSW